MYTSFLEIFTKKFLVLICRIIPVDYGRTFLRVLGLETGFDWTRKGVTSLSKFTRLPFPELLDDVTKRPSTNNKNYHYCDECIQF